jgi:hypothetical protein
LGSRRRTIEPSSKKAVQKFNGSFELLAPLPQKALDILGVLGADGVATEAVRVAGCCKSNVTYWKNKFVRAGALRLKQDGIVKYYELTSYGSKLLTGSDDVVRLPVLLEDHAVKFKVLRRERVRLDWRKLGEPRNWVKLGVRLGTVRVVLNLGLEPSVVIHPGQMKGFNVDELEMDAARVVERVRIILDERFGMGLSDVGEPLRKPRFRVYRPECHAWIEAGTIEVDDNRGLDASPTHDKQDILCGRPHLEYEDKRHAAIAAAFPVSVAYDGRKNLGRAAVDFPLTLESLEWKVGSLCSQVAFLVKDNVEKTQLIERLTVANERLTDILIKLFGLEGVQGQSQSNSQPSKASVYGGRDYVS